MKNINNDDEAYQEKNCLLCSLAPILGLDVEELKRNIYLTYGDQYTKDSANILSEIYLKQRVIDINNDISDQIKGVITLLKNEVFVRKITHLRNVKKEKSVQVKEETVKIKFEKDELCKCQEKLKEIYDKINNNTSFIVLVAGEGFLSVAERGTHFIYGQKDNSGNVSFVDFQRDIGNNLDIPTVEIEPVFSVLEGKDPLLSRSNCDVSVEFILFDFIAPLNIQDRILTFKRAQNNPGNISNYDSRVLSGYSKRPDSIRLKSNHISYKANRKCC